MIPVGEKYNYSVPLLLLRNMMSISPFQKGESSRSQGQKLRSIETIYTLSLKMLLPTWPKPLIEDHKTL